MTKEKKIGRPKGAKNIPGKATLHTEAIRCPTCGSSNRSAYFGSTIRQDIEGERDGKPFNEVVVRRCKCTDCGQVMLVKTYELKRKALGKNLRAK